MSKTYNPKDVESHKSEESAWVIVDGNGESTCFDLILSSDDMGRERASMRVWEVDRRRAGIGGGVRLETDYGGLA